MSPAARNAPAVAELEQLSSGLGGWVAVGILAVIVPAEAARSLPPGSCLAGLRVTHCGHGADVGVLPHAGLPRRAVGAAAVAISAGAVPFRRAEALPATGVGYLLMPGAAVGMPME